MLASRFFGKRMSRGALRAATQRISAISNHMMSSSIAHSDSSTVLFDSNSNVRRYILNRPEKLNALNEQMLSLLRPKIEEWSASDLCDVIVGCSVGRAFCCGGDVVSVTQNIMNSETQSNAVEYFKREFEMDYILATLKKPYVAIMDGLTLGGGVGLVALAPFRVATENTVFAMPETKIGYCPDVGSNYFLSRLDGELGTYLALTSDMLSGRAVFEHGFATHYVPSRRVPNLLVKLAGLDHPTYSMINSTIEEMTGEWESGDATPPFVGNQRAALDFAFRHNTVEEILQDLKALARGESDAKKWAAQCLDMVYKRSPTSLKVALKAIRLGKKLSLLEVLNMELKIATAFCNGASSDFSIGVKSVLLDRSTERPNWSPASIEDVSDDMVSRFFDTDSPFLKSVPKLTTPKDKSPGNIALYLKYTLPTEEEIGQVVMGKHRRSSETTSIRLEELLSLFATLYPGKIGVEGKVMEVVRRKCTIEENSDGKAIWLKWKKS